MFKVAAAGLLTKAAHFATITSKDNYLQCNKYLSPSGGRIERTHEMDNLLDKLHQIQDRLTIKQRTLCKFIIQNSKTVYLMPIGELEEKSGVGRATIMRLLNTLGYNSFVEFKRDLNAACSIGFEADKVSNPFFWSKSSDRISGSMAECLEESISLLQKTAAETDSDQFSRMIDLLMSAQKVNVLGLRASKPIAQYMTYQLRYFVDAVDLSENESMVFDWIFRCQRGELLLLISSNPTTATSIRVARLCRERDMPVVVITDKPDASILEYATNHICVSRSDSSRLSILPHMLVIEAIINELGIRMAPVSVRTVDQLNQFFLQQKIITD